MRKLLSGVALAVAVPVIAIGATAQPAEALGAQKCKSIDVVGENPDVCVSMTYRRKSGGGFIVDTVRIDASDIGASFTFESNPAVDGHSLDIVNSNGVVIWHKGDAESNIACGFGCDRNWSPGLNTNTGARYLTLVYDFTARLDFHDDIRDSVSLTVS